MPWQPPVRAMAMPSHSTAAATGSASRPERAQPLLVLRLAEDGDVAGQQPLRRPVQVVPVQMRDEHRVEAVHDLLGRDR